MYDYMKALQRQFETDSRLIQDLNDEVDRTHKELSSRLAKDDRKLLLRLRPCLTPPYELRPSTTHLARHKASAQPATTQLLPADKAEL